MRPNYSSGKVVTRLSTAPATTMICMSSTMLMVLFMLCTPLMTASSINTLSMEDKATYENGRAVVPGTARCTMAVLDWLTFHTTLGSMLVKIVERSEDGKKYSIIFQYGLDEDYHDLVNYINQTI